MRSLITEAIRTCVLEWPRLATTLLRIQPRPKDGIGTVALDSHLRLYYDPEWLQGVDFNEVVFAIKQDLVHCLLKHPVRSQSILGHSKGAHRRYIQEKLNVAADSLSGTFSMESVRIFLIRQLTQGKLCQSRTNRI